ncbi:hypothetical protein CAEBREN_10226 [Caenorhabditis brenneri]|uniref:T-box domain-containing protein n=1 Tax=Caenorhabditis brenneri TaxID=135651 RepID=G0P596_CAEBE|nr:hypothetical protein CAEBREN_10226 [Caenorhabditis brenneri]
MPATINVALTPEYDSIWQNCSNLGHDMIITTQIRRIFPTIEYIISGLEENKFYKMSIHMDFVDNYKLRFDNMTGEYTTSISREPKAEPRIVWHPKGSQSGQEWMSNTVSFDHVRITCKKILESESKNIVHLLSAHRYIPVLTIYENDLPIHTAKIQHMVFNASTQYHSNGVREYKRSINKFSTKSEAEEKVGIVSSRKRGFNNPETLETAKQPKLSGFMMEDLIGKDVPSTSSVAHPGHSGAGLSRSVQSATPKSRGKKSIKSIIPSPPLATSLLCSSAFGALPAPVSSNLSILTPPITPGSAEVKTPPTTPTSQQIHGGAPPAAPLRPARAAAVSPLCSTQTAPSPPLMAFPEFPMMSFPMMPMMVPLFNPFLIPLMANMFPIQPIIPFNNDTQTPPGATDDNIYETAEIDIAN